MLKAQFINENIVDFKRGIGPKKSMQIGDLYSLKIVAEELNELMGLDPPINIKEHDIDELRRQLIEGIKILYKNEIKDLSDIAREIVLEIKAKENIKLSDE